ncbi:family 43 glycosylhydrolase [Thalassobellus suaedae]|uniref:Family 43 glycosylhydrolase n=1 Tax=Thalassobellus suaedae TaxID=3074124 RepID=A0ABY9XXF4_9FLAO|nr:family 43 glycosylhydrolase [Flavobacteriaceae bacterium HL-DH14]
MVPSTALNPIPEGARNKRIREYGFNINSANKTITLAVNYGTNLTQFNPEIFASLGTEIMPLGSQDFSGGAVDYQFTINGTTNTYSVSVNIEVNPVIPDFHADPEILYSEKTGRFYMYPTTDGFPGWSSSTFDVFSSPDLVNWTNEGEILDLSTNQVS